MKKISTIILTLFISLQVGGQDWYKQIADQVKMVDRIKSNEPWETIYHFAKKELNLSPESLADISKTIEYKNSSENQTIIDIFFHTICDSVYVEFPYRRSGHLSNDLYTLASSDNSEFGFILAKEFGKNLYGEFASLLRLDKDALLPQLQEYLRNDGLTRLCVQPYDWDEIPYCLSMSDVAMELVELKTYCDFFDNASHPSMLFSNLDNDTKNSILKKVSDWYAETKLQTTSESIVYFLDKFTDLGHSYTYTCNNLKFIGDSTLANKKLNERDTFMKCGMSMANYPFWDVDYEDCIELMLTRDNYLYKDRDLSSVVERDFSRPPLAKRTDYWDDWHIIFGALLTYDKKDIPKTLLALMQIKATVNESELSNKEEWKIQYPLEYKNNFRVCDFALIKYHELITNVEVNNWLDSSQRDIWIEKLTVQHGD